MKRFITHNNLSNLLIVTLGTFIVFILLTFFFHYKNEIIGLILTILIVLTMVSFIIDVLIQDIRDKLMWFIIILLFPFFAIPIYLNKRSSLLEPRNESGEKGKILKKIFVILLIVAFIVNIIGAVFKIQHYPHASIFLTGGLILQVVSLIGLLVVLPLIKKRKIQNQE